MKESALSVTFSSRRPKMGGDRMRMTFDRRKAEKRGKSFGFSRRTRGWNQVAWIPAWSGPKTTQEKRRELEELS